MVGDEIVAEFSGEVYGTVLETTSAVQRFSDTSVRLRFVYIREYAGENSYIGKYISDRTTFINNTYVLSGTSYRTFKYIDLYNLGCCYQTSPAKYAIQGTY